MNNEVRFIVAGDKYSTQKHFCATFSFLVLLTEIKPNNTHITHFEFPLQQWSRDRTSILHYTYSVFLLMIGSRIILRDAVLTTEVHSVLQYGTYKLSTEVRDHETFKMQGCNHNSEKNSYLTERNLRSSHYCSNKKKSFSL